MITKELYDKVLSRFGIKDCALGDMSISKGDKFCLTQCFKNDLKQTEMQKFPYVSAAGSFIYAQVCKRLDIPYIVGMLGRYLSNLGMDHWKAANRLCGIYKEQKTTCSHIGD